MLSNWSLTVVGATLVVLPYAGDEAIKLACALASPALNVHETTAVSSPAIILEAVLRFFKVNGMLFYCAHCPALRKHP
jgi:hypothetical protein